MSTEISIAGDREAKSFDFSIRHDSGVVPATFWNGSSNAASRPPLTLLQHGGPLHKNHERTRWLANAIVEGTGSAVLLIDGPIHGQRRSDQPELMEMLGIFKQFWQESGGFDSYVVDWRMALDAVLDQGWADADRVAWFGVSMGTAYGIPFCVAEDRIRAAAMGMWGLDWGQEDRLLRDAKKMQVPVLFQIKEGDEIFSTEGQRALFDALGSPNKCLHTFPGGHSLEAPGQLDEMLAFISQAFVKAAI